MDDFNKKQQRLDKLRQIAEARGCKNLTKRFRKLYDAREAGRGFRDETRGDSYEIATKIFGS